MMISEKNIGMRTVVYIYMVLGLLPVLTASCSGEDRSDEQPKVPSGVTLAVDAQGDSCVLHGHVEDSHYSSLTKCGFDWGNDTLSNTVAKDGAYDFADTLRNLESGRYFVVAYATNYMGTSRSDTAYFEIGNSAED